MHLFSHRVDGAIPSGIKLAFDFDSTIAYTSMLFKQNVAKYHDERQTGQPIWPDMFNKGFHIEVPGMSKSQVWKYIIQPGLDNTMQAPPMEGAIDFLRFWYGVTGDPITIITSRPEKNMPVVAQWIATYAEVAAKIIMAPTHNSKVQICEEEGVTDFVDDRYRTCKLLSEAGFTVWMMEQPWNTNRDTPNCFLGNWSDIMNYYFQLYTMAISGANLTDPQ